MLCAGSGLCAARVDSVTATYVGPTANASRKIAVRIEQLPSLSGIVDVGAVDYQFTGPAEGAGESLAGTMMPTFGVEAETVLDTTRRFTIRPVGSGPEPVERNLAAPARYGQRRESLVHAVIGAAIRLRWLMPDGTIGQAADLDERRDRMAAVQLLVWESVLETHEAPERLSLSDGSFTASLGQTPGVGLKVAELSSVAGSMLESNAGVDGLRTITTRDSQDRLVIVPEHQPKPRVRRRIDRGVYFDDSDSGSTSRVPGSPQPHGTVVIPDNPPSPPTVPLPPAVWSGAVGLAIVAVLSRVRRNCE